MLRIEQLVLVSKWLRYIVKSAREWIVDSQMDCASFQRNVLINVHCWPLGACNDSSEHLAFSFDARGVFMYPIL
ncbi:hypothetical protein PS861_01466 [Pseudomonas fluorescens]|nr:hypothetical protein PS861_01466 [Pseudomonas fluorescens]